MSSQVHASSKVVDDNIVVMPLVSKEQPAARTISTEFDRTEKEVTEDTECGWGFIRGKLLQRLANRNTYLFLYGVTALFLSAAMTYSNATITTIEKRFKIPSKTIGFIAVGNDITQLCISMFLSYYAGKGHRPRWLAFSVYTSVIYCLLYFLPHLIFGPGDDALSLTREYGQLNSNTSGAPEPVDKDAVKDLCTLAAGSIHCDQSDGHFAAPVIIFVGLLVSGVGGSLFYTIGISYLDDNTKKKAAPGQLTVIILIRMLGPALGYWLASFCLSKYIAPTLTPTIDQQDPRWLGAWWAGWILLAGSLAVFGSSLGLFPKVLPKAAGRKAAASAEAKEQILNGANKSSDKVPEHPPSFSDMKRTFQRLLKNPILMFNTAASVFYVFGYEPYWVFMAKYIETQYRKSASVANLTTGTVGIMFCAVGVTLSGFVITKYKPTARQMALWNVFVGLVCVLCITSYTFLGCPGNNTFGEVTSEGEIQTNFKCNTQCDCEYVPYSPVCAADGKSTFISACHAGCSSFTVDDGGTKTYTNCSCIPPKNADPAALQNWTLSSSAWTDGGWARHGSCPVDCNSSFIVFVAVVCLLKFCGSTGGTANFLITVRSVAEKDKPVAMAFEATIISIFALMPSLIMYGYLIDATCLVWGKTCSGTGNCWLYNNESLRYLLNLTASAFLLIGVIFDIAVWYLVKNLQIFDEEEQDQPEKVSMKNVEEEKVHR